MARINAGVNPKYLSDQHLIAESVEITMITGAIIKDNFLIKGKVPLEYCLGTGHINFFKPKLLYLVERLRQVNYEMKRRNFKPGTTIDLSKFPDELIYDWEPTFKDSCIVRQRICERLLTPLKAKSGYHRYYGESIQDMPSFCNVLKTSKLFYV